MKVKITSTVLALVVLLLSGNVNAALIEFVPPNDTSGYSLTTSVNDGWDGGRGLVFQMTADTVIDSIGVFLDVTGMNLSYEIAQVISTSGVVTTGQTVIANGEATVSTNGLEWVDFGITNLLLSQGNLYHIEFTYTGIGNQVFYYINDNVAFSQDGFSSIDGTSYEYASNFVMPGIRVNTVPIPSAVWLFGSGLIGLIGLARRRANA